MKLVVVINSLATGGAEKLVTDSIPKYAAMGVEVQVLLLKGDTHPFYKKLASQNCCKIHSLEAKSLYNPLLAFKMIPFFNKADIVHVHIFPSLYWASIAKIFSRSKAKFVYTEHSTTNRRRTLIYKWVDRFIYGRYDKIVTISDEVDTAIKLHLKYATNRFVQIQNGVDLEAINNARPSEDLFFEANVKQKLLLQVSRFYYPKDQATVIRALKLLPSYCKLLLVGEGDQKKEMEALVAELNLKERVRFLGLRNDIPALLKRADFVLLSSFYEGLSLASIEGMASGRPFIAADAPGLRPIVAGAGVLFPIGDEKALSDKIVHLLEDKTAYAQIAAQCQERAKSYGINEMIKAYMDLYNQLLTN